MRDERKSRDTAALPEAGTYDLARVDDPLYVLRPGTDTYEPLGADFADTIAAGKAGY